MRLVVELWDSRVLRGPSNCHDALLTSEFLPIMKNMVDVALDSWLRGKSIDQKEGVIHQVQTVLLLKALVVLDVGPSPIF